MSAWLKGFAKQRESGTEADRADAWTARTRARAEMVIGQWVRQRGMADGEVHD